jgi:DNA-binding MarR family transcriptional regulator
MSTASTLLRVITVIAEAVGRDSSLTLALVFARVAAAGPSGVLQVTVQRELGLTDSVLTRSVQTLSNLHYGKQRAGLDLIYREIDSADCRHRILRATPKGVELVTRATTGSRGCI